MKRYIPFFLINILLLQRNFFSYFIKQRYCQNQLLKVRSKLYYNIFLNLGDKTDCLNNQLHISSKDNSMITKNSYIILSSNLLSHSYHYYYLHITNLFSLNLLKNNLYNIKCIKCIHSPFISNLKTINLNTQRISIQKSLTNINGWKKNTWLYQVYIINHILLLLRYNLNNINQRTHFYNKKYDNHNINNSLSFLFWRKLDKYLNATNITLLKSFFLEDLFISKWRNEEKNKNQVI